jgi:hypothetical protein
MMLKSLFVAAFSVLLGIGFEVALAYVHHLESWIDGVKWATSLPPELWESVITRPHPRDSVGTQLEMSAFKAMGSASWFILGGATVFVCSKLLQLARLTVSFWIILVVLLTSVGIAVYLESIYTLQLSYPWARPLSLSVAASVAVAIALAARHPRHGLKN